MVLSIVDQRFHRAILEAFDYFMLPDAVLLPELPSCCITDKVVHGTFLEYCNYNVTLLQPRVSIQSIEAFGTLFCQRELSWLKTSARHISCSYRRRSGNYY